MFWIINCPLIVTSTDTVPMIVPFSSQVRYLLNSPPPPRYRCRHYSYDLLNLCPPTWSKSSSCTGASRLAGVLYNTSMQELTREGLEQQLTFAGFVVISCPLKPDSRAVIKELVHSSHQVHTVCLQQQFYIVLQSQFECLAEFCFFF
jgi:hypothetical protein